MQTIHFVGYIDTGIDEQTEYKVVSGFFLESNLVH
jgi:hypothetical protein